jgi:hypothetical protein
MQRVRKAWVMRDKRKQRFFFFRFLLKSRWTDHQSRGTHCHCFFFPRLYLRTVPGVTVSTHDK